MRIAVAISVVASVLTGTAQAFDIIDCLKEGERWLSPNRPVLAEDSLRVAGWSRLYLERKPEREDVDDCERTRINDAFVMRYEPEPRFEVVGCRGDFDGNSRDDYCLLLRREADNGITPHVFLAVPGGYQIIALQPVFDPYGLAEDSTWCPGPYALPLPENEVFQFETEYGSYEYRAVGELIQVGWHTYAWTDSGFQVAYMAD